jgi:hypothetical protein
LSNFKSQIRAYDIIEISKLHTNNIFSKIKKGESQIDFSNQKFIKKRPAIVLKNFNNFFIVLPLTTRSINNNENCKEHLTLRTSFSI